MFNTENSSCKNSSLCKDHDHIIVYIIVYKYLLELLIKKNKRNKIRITTE